MQAIFHRAAVFPVPGTATRLAAREPAQQGGRPAHRRRPVHRYYDEWKAADALGYNIMVNGATTRPRPACRRRDRRAVGAGGGETQEGRILVLGIDRPPAGPLRCAEELATIDVISPAARHGLHQGRALRISGVEPETRSA